MASPHAALRESVHSHIDAVGETCPVCDQPIPNDKVKAVHARMEAQERALVDAAKADALRLIAVEKARIDAAADAMIESGRRENAAALKKIMDESVAREAAARAAGKNEADAVLQEQVATAERSKADAEAALQDRISSLEHAQRDAVAEAERVKAEAAARETAAREEARRAAEEAAQASINAAETVRQEKEAVLVAQLTDLSQAKAAAEEAKADLAAQVDEIRAAGEVAIAKAVQEAAEREQTIRAETALAVEEVRNAAEQAKTETESTLLNQLTAAAEEIQGLKEAHASEVNLQREALEKDKISAVNAERAQKLDMQMRLEGQLQDIQRQLQKKTADELGEGAELELYDVLKAAFEDDKIRRVQKGTAGADIIHEVVHNGKVCGKIVYDSKNRNNWKSDYAAKLRADQIAEKADHAILSSNKFPAGARQLHIEDHVIIACPARVLALAELLRGHSIQTHELRISNEAREEKSAALYAFITSERCAQLLDSVDVLIRKLEQIEVDEQKAHSTVWKKRGELLKAVLKANGNLCFEIDRITGISEATA